MKNIIIDQVADPVLVATNKRLLDAVNGTKQSVLAACGGKGLCATCHVFVDKGMDQLSPRTPREESSLRMLSDYKPNSRLACQAKILGSGVVVSLPRGRYIESTNDLTTLIGRRADEPILHPVDGRTLIDQGKIITRSRIMELASVDVDVAEMKQRSLTVRD